MLGDTLGPAYVSTISPALPLNGMIGADLTLGLLGFAAKATRKQVVVE